MHTVSHPILIIDALLIVNINMNETHATNYYANVLCYGLVYGPVPKMCWKLSIGENHIGCSFQPFSWSIHIIKMTPLCYNGSTIKPALPWYNKNFKQIIKLVSHELWQQIPFCASNYWVQSQGTRTNPSFEMMMVTSTVEQFSLWNFKFQHQKLVRPLYENE